MTPALQPANLTSLERPSWLVRVVIALTTRPIAPGFTVSPPLDAYLARLKGAGWTLREAYYRNWVIWRYRSGNPHGLIVFPAERSIASEEDFALFIAVETLRCTKLTEPLNDGAYVAALCPRLAQLPLPELQSRYRRAKQQLLRLRWWR